MKNFFKLILLIIFCSYPGVTFLQETNNDLPGDIKLPETPAGQIFRDFIDAYNTGNEGYLKSFAEKHYAKEIEDKVDYWMEIYYRFGPASMFSISIDKPYDIEVWLHGKFTNAWFGVELILKEETGKIKATGLLTGQQPDNAPDISVPEKELPGKLSSYLTTLSDSGYFSGTVLVAKDGAPVFEGAYGYANKELNMLNGIDTRFNLASITKVFTGIAIAQLVEQGKISYNDLIEKYIPEYPRDISEKVTIHHLLTHTSGIELDHTDEFNTAKRNSKNLEELLNVHLQYLHTLKNRENFEPLKKFDYSNEGYDLAALIVERVSGKNFLDYLRENIFIPAGMNNTGVRTENPKDGNSATGYTHYKDLDMTFDRHEEIPNTIFLDPFSGSSGLYSSVEDLNLLVKALMGNVLLSPEYVNEITTSRIDVFGNGVNGRSYGYGFDLLKENGILSIGHNGGIIGGSTELRYYPESGYTVIVLSNFRHSAIIVSNYIRDLLF